MEYIILNDTSIFAVNRGKQGNESSNIVYRDKEGKFHSVDFDICAENFKKEHKNSSGNCIGERNINEYSFVFYTSGIKIKIVFQKKHVRSLFRYHLLSGLKVSRFHSLQNLINSTGYSTYDLS